MSLLACQLINNSIVSYCYMLFTVCCMPHASQWHENGHLILPGDHLYIQSQAAVTLHHSTCHPTSLYLSPYITLPVTLHHSDPGHVRFPQRKQQLLQV
jgi:hypothetical protein